MRHPHRARGASLSKNKKWGRFFRRKNRGCPHGRNCKGFRPLGQLITDLTPIDNEGRAPQRRIIKADSGSPPKGFASLADRTDLTSQQTVAKKATLLSYFPLDTDKNHWYYDLANLTT